MTAQLTPLPIFRSWDNLGLPLVGGKLNTYVAGTTTPQATYTDSTQATPNTNPVILNFRGEAFVWLDPTLTYKFVLTDASNNLIWTEDNIPGGFSPSAVVSSLSPTPTNTLTLGNVSKSWANAYFGPSNVPVFDTASGNIGYYARTAAEISAGVTPTNYVYEPDPIADVRRYGWSSSNTASQNTTALTTAISVRTAAGGGIVQLPAGNFNITDSIVIPQNVMVRGVGGTQGTTVTSSSTGSPAFLLGGTISGVFKYGCSLTDVEITLSNATGKAVQLMETVQGVLRNIFIQGPISAGRSTKGVVIDGGNVGAFFNLIENVECSHIHIGFDQLSSGTTAPTMQIFNNISGTGDVGTDTTSIGYRLQGTSNTGNGTVITGADFEGCKQGYYATSGCGGTTIVGFRGEGNTVDILCETGAGAQVFLGGVCDIPSGKILVNTSVPLNTINGAGVPHRFWGMVNGTNGPNNGYWSGTNYFYGATAGDAFTIVAFPGDTTVPILDLQNSSGNHLFQVSAQGKILRIANGAPVTVTGAKGGNLALASLLTTLASYGLIVDGTT